MIPSAAGVLMRTVSAPLPRMPNLPAVAALLCTNNTAGSGTFTMAFNTTSLAGTFSASSSLGTPQSISVPYFSAGGILDTSAYEVRASINLSPTTGSNIALAGGSSPLNTWITLSTSPSFNFTCSGRRSGYAEIQIQLRHKVETPYSSTRVYMLGQDSDAVTPTFSGTTLLPFSKLSPETAVLGFYLDAATSANQFQTRAYRDGVLIVSNTLGFSTGSISENEYEIYNLEHYTNGSGLVYNVGQGTGAISGKRGFPASSLSGTYFTSPAIGTSGVGFIRVYIRHITDINKAESVTLDFTMN